MVETILVLYGTSFVLSYGIGFAYQQRKYPDMAKRDYWLDMRTEMFMALAGPVNLYYKLKYYGFRRGVKLW